MMIKHQILDGFPTFSTSRSGLKTSLDSCLNLPFIAILNAVQTIRFLVLIFHSFPSTKNNIFHSFPSKNPFIPIKNLGGSWLSMNKILIFHGFPWISWPHFMAHHRDHPELILRPAPARRHPGSSAASRPAPG